jgi:hypothetical protein
MLCLLGVYGCGGKGDVEGRNGCGLRDACRGAGIGLIGVLMLRPEGPAASVELLVVLSRMLVVQDGRARVCGLQ